MTQKSDKPPVSKMFLEPTTLYYPPPLSTRSISNAITVYNRSEVQCVFKVHSSEPEMYIVKPSSGLLPPKSALRVTITLRKMPAEPADVAEFGKKQRFKVRGKVVPPAIASKLTAGSHASDVWKQCDALPYDMDTNLVCNFSGEVASGAAVTFEAGADVVSPVNKEDPYATAKRTAAAAAASKNVTFGANEVAAAAASNIKSSLKGDGTTPKNASELASAESASIKANTTTKQALAGSVGDFRDQKSQLEKEIRDRQALLANLKASTLPSSNQDKPAKKSKKVPKLSLAAALVLIILFYVGGTVARVKVGGDTVGRYVETYIPAEVRSAVSTSRLALDDALAPVLQQVSDQYANVANVLTSATSNNEAAQQVVVVEEAAATEPVAAVAPTPDEEGAKVAAGGAAANPIEDKAEDATAAGQQPAKKRRKKKVKKD